MEHSCVGHRKNGLEIVGSRVLTQRFFQKTPKKKSTPFVRRIDDEILYFFRISNRNEFLQHFATDLVSGSIKAGFRLLFHNQFSPHIPTI